MKKILILLFLLTLSVSCAISPSPISPSKAKLISRDMSLSVSCSKFINPGGNVTITRDTGFGGSANTLIIFVDGEECVNLETGEKVVFLLHEGNEYILGVLPESIPWAFTQQEISLIVRENKQYYFRVGFGQGGLFLQRTSFTK